MTGNIETDPNEKSVQSGILSLLAIAGYYRIAYDQAYLERELDLVGSGTSPSAAG